MISTSTVYDIFYANVGLFFLSQNKLITRKNETYLKPEDDK